MADDALNCIKAFLQSVPTWIADIQDILDNTVARQNEILFEQQPADKPLYDPRYRPSVSSSANNSIEDTGVDTHHHERAESQAPLLQPQLAHLTGSDVLRLSQRKRKTASVCSGDQSGPRKYRSRAMVVVYYDGDTQKRFETLVRDIGIGRNAVRKGKMRAGVTTSMTRVSRASSSGSDRSQEDDNEESLDLSKLQYKSIRMLRGPSAADESTAAFDKIDTFVEHSQSLCERAAHQVLRDGDCALELNNAKEQLSQAVKAAEDELPKLEERSQHDLDRRRERDEQLRTQDGVAEDPPNEKEAPPDVSPVPSLVPSLPSDGNLEADLEADDAESEDEAEDFTPAAFSPGKYQYRSTRLMAH